MLLYLVQHGEAKREEEDPQRGLTDRGRQDVEKMAAYGGRVNLRVDEIFHSAKHRAAQTAMILAEHLRPEKGIDQADNLLPMDDPGLWALRIAGMTGNIMLVGHLPFMAKLAGLLLCGSEGQKTVDFKPGGIVCLRRFEDGRWTLGWMILPEMVK